MSKLIALYSLILLSPEICFAQDSNLQSNSNLIGLLTLLAQPITCAWSHGEKLEAELVLDAKKLRTSSADDTSPEQAIEVAARKGLIEVIIARIGNRDYTVRAKALGRTAGGFPLHSKEWPLRRY